MSAFRKRADLVHRVDHGSVLIDQVVMPVTTTAVPAGSNEPTTFVEMKHVSVRDYAEKLGLPKDEDYQLRDMLAAGIIPKEVPVSGMIDSNDPLDLSNAGVDTTILGKLQEVSPVASETPPEPVSTPEPTTTPAE